MKERRFDYILNQLALHDKVNVLQLAEDLNVTPETIRRDLTELEEARKLTRIHGGGVPYRSSSQEMQYDLKLSYMEKEKKRIARKAAALIKSGDMIAIDGGTTTVHIADYLNGITDLVIVTHSLPLALKINQALEEGRITGQLLVAPGYSYFAQGTVKGSMTVQFFENCHFDKAFISCGGIQNNVVTDYDFEEVQISRMMIQQSRQNYLLADQSKQNSRTSFSISKLDELIWLTEED